MVLKSVIYKCLSGLILATCLLGCISAAAQYEFHEDSVIRRLSGERELATAITLQAENSDFFKAENNWSKYYQSERRLARLYQDNRQWEKSLATIEGAMRDSQQREGEVSENYVRCAKTKAELMLAEGYWDEVIAVLLDAERIALQLEDSDKWIHGIYVTAGRMYYQSGDYVSALPYFQKRLQTSLRIHIDDSITLGKAYYNVGSTFWGLDERDSCKAYYAEAIKVWRESQGDDFEYLMYMYDVLGSYAWEEGQNEEALGYFNRAGEIQLLSGGESNEGDRLQSSADQLAENGLLEEALQGYQDALAYRIENLGWANVSTAGCYNYIARTLAQMDDHEAALQACSDALARYCPDFKPQSIFDTPENVEIHKGLHFLLDVLFVRFDILRSMGDVADESELARAQRETIDKSIEVIDLLRTGKRTERSQVFWTSKVNPFFESAISHYASCYLQSADAQMLDEIFLLMEKSRAFVLNQANRELAAMDVAGIPTEIQQEERDLKKSLTDLMAFIDLEEKRCEYADVDKLDVWQQEEVRIRAEYARFIAELEKNYPDYYQLKYDPQTITLGEIQTRLGSASQLVSYFIGEEQAYALRIMDSECELFEIETPTDISRKILQFRGLIDSPTEHLTSPQSTYTQFIQTASELAQSLFPLSWCDYEETVIIPDGLLHYLPFDLLLVSSPSSSARNYRDLDYLLRHTTISTTPSASLFSLQMEKQPRASNRYAGFAPSYDITDQEVYPWNEIEALTHNLTEVNKVNELVGGSSFAGVKATEAVFKSQSAKAAILHLAMHTNIQDDEPGFSGFLFNGPDASEDGVLQTHEIYSLSLEAQLAVLSSCNTGKGELQKGEGVFSLARGFSYAGCPSILMTLWECDDASTQQLVQSFFSASLEGQTKSSALRQAKLDYLTNCDDVQAFPYYWSGLTLVGNTKPLDLPNESNWYFYLILVVAIVIGVGLRKRLL